MENVTIKVSTDQMVTKAEEISEELNGITQDFDVLRNIVIGSKSYWQGGGSNKHQTFLSSVENDMERILKRLREYPEDLLKMAGLYEDTEAKATGYAQALSTDIIS